MQVETVLSMRPGVCHSKQMRQGVGDCFPSCTWRMTAINLLAQGYGLQPDDRDGVRLSIAQCSL